MKLYADHGMNIQIIAETVNGDTETVRKVLLDELNMIKSVRSWLQKI